MTLRTTARTVRRPQLSSHANGVLVTVVVSLGWGCSFLLIRESLLVTDPYGIAWSRVAIGALVLGCLPASPRRRGLTA